MKLSNQILGMALGITALGSSACGMLQSNSTEPTRAATQTPFIVFVPVTTTPEPATVTPLATVTPATAATPLRTATRVAAVRPTATRTRTAAPVAVGPSPTTAPACAFAAPTLIDPNDNAERKTFETRPGSDTFVFKWAPPAGIGGDDIGYKISMEARGVGGKVVNSDAVHIYHNKYVSDSQKQECGGSQSCFIYDKQRVWGMKQGGDDATISWFVSVVKISGAVTDQGYLGAGAKAVECSGSQSARRSIILRVLEAP